MPEFKGNNTWHLEKGEVILNGVSVKDYTSNRHNAKLITISAGSEVEVNPIPPFPFNKEEFILLREVGNHEWIVFKGDEVGDVVYNQDLS
jgi:hypothetical protein